MRQQERAVNEMPDLLKIIEKCQVCRLGMMDEHGQPYIVPINFGYAIEDERLSLYFHSAAEGHKIDCLRQEPRVCFEMDCAHALVQGGKACQHSFKYQSIIGYGRIEFLESPEEKAEGLLKIFSHLTSLLNPTFDPAALARTTVLRLRVEQISGKQNLE